METVTSTDGTTIAYESFGDGDPLVLVVGAFNERAAGEPLARALSDRYRTVVYDRRGRGDSTDAGAASPDREVEDLAAVLGAVGGSAAVFGYSSGAVLALRAAVAGLAIPRLALYEPPTPQPGKDPEFWLDLADRLDHAVARGDRGAAVELFQLDAVGIPEAVIVSLRDAPFRPALEALAPTLAYEARVLAADPWLPAAVTVPALVAVGGASPELLQDVARSVSSTLAAGELRILPGLGHDIDPAAVGAAVAEFLGRAGTVVN